MSKKGCPFTTAECDGERGREKTMGSVIPFLFILQLHSQRLQSSKYLLCCGTPECCRPGSTYSMMARYSAGSM